MDQSLNELLALELVLGFLFLVVGCVVCFFVCRLLLAIAKWFECKTKSIQHDLALNNYHDDD